MGAVLCWIGMVAVWGASEHYQRNWPQWRGPLANGVAPHGTPPLEWSETKNVKWKVAIPGRGSSTPIVWDNQVLVLTAVNTGVKSDLIDASTSSSTSRSRFGSSQPTEIHRFEILSLDRNSGEVLWRKTAAELLPHEGHHRDHGFASASPVTDGRHIIAHFGSRGLFCYDMKGQLQWSKDLGDMRTRNAFGEGTSPALHHDVLIIKWDHEGEDFIAAYNKNTGEELWRKDRDERTSWSTPLIVESHGRVQVIDNATGGVRSYDLRSGEILWQAGELTANAIPCPVAGDDLVFAMSGFRGNQLYAIKLDAEGKISGTDSVVWSLQRGTPYVPSPLLYGSRLYFHKGNSGIISCFEAPTGRPHYAEERVEGISGIYASPVGAAGRVYVTGRDGTTVVLKDSEELEVLATNKLEEPIDASPAIVGGEMFLRGHRHLYCLAE